MKESLLKGLFIRVLAGFRETRIELVTSEAIFTPRIEGLGERNSSWIQSYNGEDCLKGSIDLGRDVLLGSKTPQKGCWGMDTQPHSPSALGYPSGAFH